MDLIWTNQDESTLISDKIGRFHYKIVNRNGAYEMQEFYKDNPTPNSGTVKDIEFAKYLAQSLADDVLVLD